MIFGVLRRLWIPLVILAVVVAGGFAVVRIHGIFGSAKPPSYSDTKSEQNKPFNPKHLTYEIFGPPGSIADISYFDLNAEPQRVDGAHLPWSLELTTTLPSVMGDIVAQGDSNTLGCRILVNGQVKDERVSQEVNAYVYCLVKGA